MKQLNSFSILFILTLILLAPNLAAAIIDEEASKIPFQVNNSDRIMIGTVSGIYPHYDYSIVTIKVKEWIYNPLPVEVIKVRTEIGTNVLTEDEAEFTLNESVLLMLKDEDLEKQLFRVALGFPGKHPVSDRETVIEELKVQGKWQGENQTMNKTNDTGMTEDTEGVGNQKENITESKTVDDGNAENAATVGEQEEKSNITEESNEVPFISSFWVLSIILRTVMYVRKTK